MEVGRGAFPKIGPVPFSHVIHVELPFLVVWRALRTRGTRRRDSPTCEHIMPLMSSHSRHLLTILVALSVLPVGCGPSSSAPDATSFLPDVTSLLGDIGPLPVPALPINGGLPLDSDGEVSFGSSSETSASPAADVGFAPPHPERENPFFCPGAERASVSKRSDVSGAGDVQLRGFVNAGESRVLLVLGGKPVTLRAGEEHAGVRVLAIAPPEVTLQMRGQRWTKSLIGPTSLPVEYRPSEGSVAERRPAQ